MTLLNVADKLYLGTSEVDAVYLDEEMVWPPSTASYGADESLYPVSVAPSAPTDPNRFMAGSQFTVLADGRITHHRFWHHSGSTTSRYLGLWKLNAAGTAWDKVWDGTSSGEVTGWNTTPISTPVLAVAGDMFRSAYGYDGQIPGNAFAYTPNAVPGSAHLTWTNGVYSLPTMAVGGDHNFPDQSITPNNYFSDVVYQPTETVAAFAPDDLSGLSVWLDAADYAPGSWPNKVAGGATPTFVSTPDPAWSPITMNGMPVVRFAVNAGRLRIQSGSGVHLDWTLAYVGRMSGDNVGRVVDAIYSPNNLLVGYWNGFEDVCYDNGFMSPNTQTTVTRNWRMYSGDGAPGLTRFFGNGTLLGTATTSAGWGQTFAISGYNASGTEETCDCEIAEVVQYNRKLSDEERQQVESYLREKWALT